MTRNPVIRDEAGFTLLELLIAILILGIIMPVVVATLVVGIKTTDETNTRLLDSHDIQTSAAVVSSDVEDSTSISTTDSTDCVSSSYAVGQPVLYLAWSDLATEGTSVSHQVNYYVSGTQLVRSACTAGAATSAIVMIHTLNTSTIGVTCQPTSCNSATPPPSIAIRGETTGGHMFSLIGTRRASA